MTLSKSPNTIANSAGHSQDGRTDWRNRQVGHETFRRIMGSFASGISVVTATDTDRHPHGLTCSAICSVSADPPLLLSCIRTPSGTLDAIVEAGTFAVNFLDASSRAVSDIFASYSVDKFTQVKWRHGEVTGMPILNCTVAHAECSVKQVINAGDHAIVLGRIHGGEIETERLPLNYWRGTYFSLSQQ